MSPLLELSTEELAVVCKQVDMRSLLQLRCCSGDAALAVAGVLRQNLTDLCREYLPKPESFCRALPRWRAFIGGEVAVRFMLRETPMQSASLDIYIPNEAFSQVLTHLRHVQGATLGDVVEAEDDEDQWMDDHMLNSVTLCYTALGTIHVFQSSWPDALAPLACRDNSPDVTFVNPLYFGTPYPRLLFARRGLVAEWREGEVEEVVKWGRRGIDLRLDAHCWEEYRDSACAASQWSCHAQPRLFDDEGSMCCRMVPSMSPPLQCDFMWRLDARPCGGSCLGPDAGDGFLRAFARYALL